MEAERMNDSTIREYPVTEERDRPTWIGGAILIFLGTIFLLQNTFGVYLRNWWALFILIPTVATWGTAWSIYQRNGRQVTTPVIGSFIGGLVPTLIASAFLFNLNLGMIWPFFLIIAGLGLLFTRGGWR
jgi:drug/metabolite transporter (DMT)-like permease